MDLVQCKRLLMPIIKPVLNKNEKKKKINAKELNLADKIEVSHKSKKGQV